MQLVDTMLDMDVAHCSVVTVVLGTFEGLVGKADIVVAISYRDGVVKTLYGSKYIIIRSKL